MPPVDAPDPELPPSVLEALRAGHKIEAIRRLRDERRLGLKEARDAVEAYLSAHPDVARHQPPRAESGLGRLLVAGLVLAAAYAIYHGLSQGP